MFKRIEEKLNKEENSAMKKLKQLVEEKGWKVAKSTENQEWGRENQVLSFSEHDYPASTPTLWNGVYKKLGLETRALMLVANPKNCVAILQGLKNEPACSGMTLGAGFKDEAVAQKALGKLDPWAEKIKAVNVVAKEGDFLVGYNTDGLGFLKSFQEKMAELGKDLADAQVLILGGGGTASAIVFALLGHVKKITILNRTVSKAEALAERLRQESQGTKIEAGGEERISEIAPQSQAIINTTLKGATGEFASYGALADTSSLGKNQRECDLVLRSLPPGTLVSDINLTKGDPTTIRLAKKFGLPTLDGHPMVFYQAVEAFWLVNKGQLREKNISKERIAKLMEESAK